MQDLMDILSLQSVTRSHWLDTQVPRLSADLSHSWYKLRRFDIRIPQHLEQLVQCYSHYKVMPQYLEQQLQGNPSAFRTAITRQVQCYSHSKVISKYLEQLVQCYRHYMVIHQYLDLLLQL